MITVHTAHLRPQINRRLAILFNVNQTSNPISHHKIRKIQDHTELEHKLSHAPQMGFSFGVGCSSSDMSNAITLH